ncbi:poly(A)-specific ribonuclease PARN [Cryptomeria japonica]|uniref:poly(A)-specific ribonuclease PARN n=1 Tax=Cryptomeria japonica TaxID=3369 RepID=UPI0025AD3DFB|nr:poly(A)-specific ribonuclease PARN [Cryptomeria japonica]
MWIQSLSRVSFQTLSKANYFRSSFEYRFPYQWSRLFSSSASAAGLVMANVTRGNFKVALEGLRGLIRDADFIAIDLEMSGLTSAPWRDSFEFDTLEVRYSKLADSARNFAVLQFGVCPFRWDSTSAHFFAHPHNFYIFPRNELPANIPPFDFLCQTTSIEFLAKHNFDFNVCIYEGISYLSKQQEAEVRHKLGLTDVDENKKGNSEISINQLKEIPLISIADVLFSERMKIKFGQWRDTLLRDQNSGDCATVGGNVEFHEQGCESETSFYKRRPSLLLNGLNSHQSILVKQTLRRYFKDIVYIETLDKSASVKKQVVFTHSENDRRLLMKQLDEDRHMMLESEVEQAIGFRHVIDLIASAGKLIVGHNCLLDFAHIHSKFIAPLPETVVEFATSLHKHFPYIIDTKYLLRTEPMLQNMMKKKSTSLSSAFTHMCGQFACTSDAVNKIMNSTVKVVVPAELQRYTDAHSGAKHEAGYDAYMTGCIFAQACKHLDIDLNNLHLGSDFALADKFQRYANLLYVGWIRSLVLDLTTGGEAVESRTMLQSHYLSKLIPAKLVLVWGFQTGYSESDLRGLVKGVLGTVYPVMGVYFLDASSAFIHFLNEQMAAKFLCLMEAKMEETCNFLSSQSPLTSLLETGSINAIGYDMYEQICKSSMSKLLFAEQVEALGIRWKISASLTASKNRTKKLNCETNGLRNNQNGGKMEETLQVCPVKYQGETLNSEKRRERSFSFLSEDGHDFANDTECAPSRDFAKRSRMES